MIECNKCNKQPCICNQTVPVNPVDLLGSPFQCKRQIQTRRFSSPNSPLPQEELDDLQVCIEAINHVLQSLGSESNPNNTRQLQLHFLELKGISVKASILCGLEIPTDEELENKEEIENTMIEDEGSFQNTSCIRLIQKNGKLDTAGRDFIKINPIGSKLFIPYGKLLSIARKDCAQEEHEPKFINADQETRRELAFNFGEFVSRNSDIENLFFGIPLYKALKKYVGKEVKVVTDEECSFGTLIETREGRIEIINKQDKKEIDIRLICYLQVLNLK